MKNMALLLISFALGNAAFASNKLIPETVCTKVVNGYPDPGFVVILSSNKFAWSKVVTVHEDGFAGRRVLANVNVPLQPHVLRTGVEILEQLDLVYKGVGLALTLRALDVDGRPLTGMGSLNLAVPGGGSIRARLICNRKP